MGSPSCQSLTSSTASSDSLDSSNRCRLWFSSKKPVGKLPPFLLFASVLLSLPLRIVCQDPPVELSNVSSATEAQLRDAIKKYQALLARSAAQPLSPAALFEIRTRLATAYFKLHQCTDSLEAVKPLLVQSKTSAAKKFASSETSREIESQAWTIAGLDYLELDRSEEAIPVLRRALAADPASTNARLALGDALARTRRFGEAAKEYAEQTRRSPTLPDAWYKLGLAHSASASELLANAQTRAKGSVVATQLVAEESLNQGGKLAAARLLFPIVHDAPSQPGAHADLGRALLEMGYPKAAANQLRKELVVDPNSPIAMMDLAQVAALEQDWDEAASQIVKVSEQYPKMLQRLLEFPPAGLVRQAWMEKRMRPPKSFAESRAGLVWTAWLNDSRMSDPENGHTKPQAQSCNSALHNSASPLGSWMPEACYESLRTELASRKQLTSQKQIKLSEAEFRLGHYEAAAQQAKRVLQTDPQNDWAAYWLTKSQIGLADDCFAKVVTLNPNSVRVHQMLAQQYSDALDYAKAKAEYGAAIKIAPDLPDLHLGLGTAYWRTSDWPEAEKELRITVRLAPGSTVARWRLGNTYLQENRWTEAIEQLRTVIDDPSLGLSARLDLAKAEAGLGQTSQAIQDLLRLADRDDDGEVHFRLAGLYRKSGDEARAQQALETFRKVRAASLQASKEDLDALDADLGLAAGEPDRSKVP